MPAIWELRRTIQERFEVMKRVAYAEFDITKLLERVEFRIGFGGFELSGDCTSPDATKVFRVAGLVLRVAARRNEYSKQARKWCSRYFMRAELHP